MTASIRSRLKERIWYTAQLVLQSQAKLTKLTLIDRNCWVKEALEGITTLTTSWQIINQSPSRILMDLERPGISECLEAGMRHASCQRARFQVSAALRGNQAPIDKERAKSLLNLSWEMNRRQRRALLKIPENPNLSEQLKRTLQKWWISKKSWIRSLKISRKEQTKHGCN